MFGKALTQHGVQPASGVVVGPGRQLPAAKDSRWVLDRAPLEQALSRAQARIQDGPTEGLLCSSSGRLLEGLVTSLFVVAGAPRLATRRLHIRVPGDSLRRGAEGSGRDDNAVEMQTAAPSDGVLKGIMRHYVLQASPRSCTLCAVIRPSLCYCAAHPSIPGKSAPVSMQACEQVGIPVVEQAPDPRRSHTWREAFVTNWCVEIAPGLRRLLGQSSKRSTKQ